jgi:hypothetical protein
MSDAITTQSQTAKDLKGQRLREISAKMSELGGELAAWRILPHPKAKQIEEQIEALCAEYRQVDAEP